ncbi:Lysophospholipase 1 [Coniosporium apollinis]|uniref:Lysophospholipase n=2 Tax=Coniosporium TaxID=2810619 RepID=A0ABQ9NY19_9PEZI|nr:Lysophospholipase 1 [Cladosporium sp. JES 115]KAJ9667276.1 Lysophospholipase 1 [Coniosporium apollinis]
MRFEAPVGHLLRVSAVLSAASASVIIPRDASLERDLALDLAVPLDILRRATPQAPNGYTPARVDCPSTRPTLRDASALSQQETTWLESRRSNTVGPMRDLLSRLNITGLDTNAYIDNNANNATALPNIGVACSGGGYRALMNGAGALAAFDSRTPNSTSVGHLGGLLQSTTYLSGLSGGGWLVGSLFTNNFTSVQSIIDTNPDISGSLWQFENSIFVGPATGRIQLLSSAQYYDDLYDTVSAKAEAGFNTSITDYWGRGLSYQLVNASEGGPGHTFSSIADDELFSSANAPMPILVADGRAPGEILISDNTTVYEFNPWELGSFDPTVYGFAPLRYVGSNFSQGLLPDNETCVRGFDNVGYVMGTSSTLFNQFLLQINNTGAPDVLKSVLEDVLRNIGQDNNDIADWYPNPFYQYHPETNLNAQTKRLTLVDGGEDLQNIPLHPLIQPLRAVDVIFAIDSSADTLEPGAGWPNGTALVATYQRSLNAAQQNGTAFPTIPDQNTFVNLGLNNRPTFFGCDTANLTGPAPIVVYIPNAPYIYNSNVSTFTPSYNLSERNAIISNGYHVATMGNASRDAMWPTCVGCAILSRSLDRTSTPVPEVCRQCFQTYCWNGTMNSTQPVPYQPEPIMAALALNGAVGQMVPHVLALAVSVIVGMVLVS